MLVSALTFFAAIALTRQHEVEIPVTKVSASYVYDYFTLQGRFISPLFSQNRLGFLPDGVTIEITTGKNSITAQGTLEGTRDLARIIALLDKEPQNVELDIHVYARPLNRTIAAKMLTATNSTWEYVGLASDTTIRITPIINGDGTIVIAYDLGTMGFGLYGIVRIRAGTYVYARVYTEEVVDEATGEERLALIVSHSASNDEILSFFEDADPFKDLPHDKYIHGDGEIPLRFVSWRIRQPCSRRQAVINAVGDFAVDNPPAGLDVRLELMATHEKTD